MIIDAHHHLWDPTARRYPWMTDDVAALRRRFDVADLRAAVRGTGVSATIVVQATHDVSETLSLLDSEEPVAGVVGWVDLTAPDVADALAALTSRPSLSRLVGIRHQAHDEPDPGWLSRPEVVAGVRALSTARMPFDLLIRAREHAAALALVDALPEVRFVLDHAAKPPIVDDAEGSVAIG